jgi:hypothetical protein
VGIKWTVEKVELDHNLRESGFAEADRLSDRQLEEICAAIKRSARQNATGVLLAPDARSLTPRGRSRRALAARPSRAAIWAESERAAEAYLAIPPPKRCSISPTKRRRRGRVIGDVLRCVTGEQLDTTGAVAAEREPLGRRRLGPMFDGRTRPSQKSSTD